MAPSDVAFMRTKWELLSHNEKRNYVCVLVMLYFLCWEELQGTSLNVHECFVAEAVN